MGSNPVLSQLLQGLCSDGQWKYAVFWKFQSERILTWEDGYVNKMVGDTHAGYFYDSPVDSKNQIMSSIWCNGGQYQSYAMCSIEAALLRMSSHWYSIGEEIIGVVVLTGQHCWIYDDLCSLIMFKYSEDWQLQFAAGIKTILLVPVLHHGVLQLGSLDVVLEDSVLVAQIKDLFCGLYNISTPYNSSTTLFDYSNTKRQITPTRSTDPLDIPSHDLFDLINSSAQLLTTDCQDLALSMAGSEFPLLEDVITSSFDNSVTPSPNGSLDANENDDLWINVYDKPSEFARCETVLDSDMTNLFFLDKVTDLNSKAYYRSIIHAEGAEYDNCHEFSLMDMTHQNQQGNHGCAFTLDDDEMILNSSVRPDLHKDLDAVCREEHEDFMWDSTLKLAESTSHALLRTDGYNKDVYSLLENKSSTEFLLDAVTGHVPRSSNDESSHSTDSPVACATQMQKDGAPSLDESVPIGQEFSSISVHEGLMTSTMSNSPPRDKEKPVDEECMDDMIQELHRPNSAEINKKRSRNSEFRRPRPRDRQLIQDRMKELRELVPNASEKQCSIDALLDKTTAHMLFLQSVSENAEKLMCCGDFLPNIGNKEGGREGSPNQTKQKPAESCPLRVEELDQPGHLLIEMLCKEHGLFLEIAHVFKGLQVTILKGVLENRSDELWARFVVEASQGFNQMQILCVLMHLLPRR